MSFDILSNLKASLAEQLERHRATKVAIAELRLAIAAVEGHRQTDEELPADEPTPKKKRGAVMRAVLDCIREGRGTVKQIAEVCEGRGIRTTGSSISNAIARLQRKKLIHSIEDKFGRSRWVCSESNPRRVFLSDNAEGPEASPRPSEVNGTAGVYPVAAVTHTAGA